jgi:hypothetical protein
MVGLRDHLALSALVAAVPTGLVDEVLEATGAVAERVRTLPPWVTTYHVLASAMCPSAGYDEVTELLWTTLPAAVGRELSRQRPTRGAITRARSRLGTEPLALLLRRMVRAVAGDDALTAVDLHRFQSPGSPGLWWITAPGTGLLRGCDVRGNDLGGAEAMLRSNLVTHVTANLSTAESAALQQRLGSGVRVVAARRQATAEAPWLGLRSRTRGAWEQDALARACVSAALERAWITARRRSV